MNKLYCVVLSILSMACSYDAYALCEFYVRGDLGVSSAGDLGASSSIDINTGTTNIESGNRRFHNGLASSIGLGYKPNKYFRTEIAYNRIHDLKSNLNKAVNIPGASVSLNYRQKLELHAIMANVYLDIPLHRRFAPYVGAGLGYSEIVPGIASVTFNRVGSVVDYRIYEAKSSRELSYALMTGVVVSVIKNLDIDVSYRFQDFGRSKSFNTMTRIRPTGDEVEQLPPARGPRIQTHTIMVGIRYNFETCCPALMTGRKRYNFESCCPTPMTDS